MSNQEVKETILSIIKGVEREGIENLLNYLEKKSDFFTAPASTKYHLSEEGGLARHSLNVYYRLLNLVKNEQGYSGRFTDQKFIDSVALVAIGHDICKCRFYSTSYRNVKNQAGQWEQVPYYTVEDLFPYGHGESATRF